MLINCKKWVLAATFATMLIVISTACDKPTGGVTTPDTVLVPIKRNGQTKLMCVTVAGGGAYPAFLEVWEPDANDNCFVLK
jgi:hypothetical protein